MKTKKVLAAFLSAAMVLTSMAVPVFADDAVASAGSAGGSTGSSKPGTTTTTPANPATTGDNENTEEVKIAQIGDQDYPSLKTAIEAVSDAATEVKLLNNTTESITIPKGKNITLDLNGYTFTNEVGKHTIENYGTLTITDSSTAKTGKVDNVSNGRIPLVNYEGGKVTLNGGTFDRSLENGIVGNTDKGANSCYTIKNWGNMTINEGTVVNNKSNSVKGSSAIGNGYQDGSKFDGHKNVTADDVNVKLIINGGKFTGGLNTIKNDDYAELEINGGTFENSTQQCVLNWNITKISGGSFKAESPATCAIYNGYGNDTMDKGTLTITDGNFEGKIFVYGEKATTSISGGTFSTDVSAYLADENLKVKQNSFGKYVIKNKETVQMGEKTYSTIKEALDDVQENAATIKLLNNTTESITIPEGKNITLDLNGYTLTNEENESRDKDDKLIKVGKHTIENYGTLTITDSSTAKTGKVDNVSHGKAALFNADIATAVLNGGKFMRSQETGIDQDNSGGNSWYTIANQGTLTINSGVTVENKGYFSSNIVTGNYNNKSTAVTSKLTINGGTFKGGVKTVKVDECGVLTINDGTFTNEKYACIMNWNKTEIKGGTFTSLASESVWNGRYTDTTAVGELKIAGGTFNGTVENSAKYSGGTISISSGTFSEDVSKYCVDKHFASKNSDGKYKVKNIEDIEAPVTSLYKKDKKTTSYATGTNYTLINDYSDNDKIVLFYTLDGSNPTTSTKRKVYNGEKLKINNAVTVKTVYMKACGECENCTAGKYSECTAPVYGQIGTYKYTVKKKNSNSDSSTGTSTRGVTYGGRKYTKDIFGVEHKSHNAYINGYADGTVKPNGNITREELATILYRVSNDASAVVASGDKFNDVSADRWSANAIEFMASKKVVNGYEDGSFKPENNLTRGEFAAMIARFANLTDTAAPRTFSDVNSSYWGFKNIMALNKAGYINGYEDGTFRPGANVTRAEVMTVINKIIGRSADASYVKSLDNNKFSDLDKNAWYYVDVMEATTDHNYTLNKSGVETEWSK